MFIGVIFRLSIYNLEPLFMDTAYYASLGRSIAEGDYLLQVNQMSDKPPLFFYIQALFFKLLGVSESVAVIPSFIGGMMGIGIMYFLGRDLKNSAAGIVAAFLFAISPGSVMLSALGLIDSLFMAVTLLSFWTLFHRRYYWSGLLIGIAFGMKQTVLAFGPLYLLSLLIIEFHHHSGKNAFRIITRSVLQMIPGFFAFFFPILYWGIFITSERMELFQYVTGFISGEQNTQFDGTVASRVSLLQADLGEVTGLSWHWIVGFLLLSMLMLTSSVIRQKLKKGGVSLPDKLNVCMNLFTAFFFYLLIFVARKYTGVHYVFPVFPFLILASSITLVELVGNAFVGCRKKNTEKYLVIILGVILFSGVLPNATLRVRQIGEGLKNAPFQGSREMVKSIKPYLLNGESLLFTETLGWMLRYYLFGDKYRNLHYDFGNQNMENMKVLLAKEPYTNYYLLLYRLRFGDLLPMRKILAPEYRVDEIFKSNGDNFRFYKIVPAISEISKNNQQLPKEWGKEWADWWNKILIRKWPDSKNIKITSQWNETIQQFEVKLLAEQVPFKGLVVSRMDVLIKSPTPSITLSKFYNWPVFQEHEGISMQLFINEKTMEKSILERFKQVKKIQFSTDQSSTNIHTFGQVEATSLEINTDVHLKLEPELVRVEILRFLLNNWDLTWFTSLFNNHLIPPLKVNNYPLLELRLINVKQQQGLIIFDYEASGRMSK